MENAPELAVTKTTGLFQECQKLLVFVKTDMGQTNEQQRRFNEWPISELLWEADSTQTNLKPLFTLQQ